MPIKTTPPSKRFGWDGYKENRTRAAREWDVVQASPSRRGKFVPFFIAAQTRATTGQRTVLWDATRFLNGGDDLLNFAQEIGSCVGWGAKHAADYSQAYEIAVDKQAEAFRLYSPAYIYGTSRVQIGGGRLGREDGSLGVWAAEAVMKHGIIPIDTEGIPPQTGSLCKEWGQNGPPKEFLKLGQQHPIRSAARLRSYEQVRDALANGYACTIASMRGFRMQLEYDAKTKKHWFTGRDSWPHQMSLLGVDDNPRRPGVYRYNSWGPDAHGPQKDGPAGGGWYDADQLDRELRDPNTECFAFSDVVGFPERLPNYFWI